MKEFSIEEKAKAYDEVREKIAIRFGSNVADEIFSQFEMSEDERIRKEIIAFLTYYHTGQGNSVKYDHDWIAWLETQGEHANFRNKIQVGDEVTRNEDGVLVNLSQLNRVAKKDEKQGEQKPTEDEDREYAYQSPEHYTRRELMIYNLGIYNGKKMVEDAIKETKQKPAWSEDDIEFIDDLLSYFDGAALKHMSGQVRYWLKSLKDRVQPQP